MNHFKLTIAIFCATLYSRFALADGGTVLISEEQYGCRITVMASPTPLRAGPVDVSVLVQRGDTSEIVSDADVQVLLTPDGDDQPPLLSAATQAASTNKLFKGALFTLPHSGRWRLSTVVTMRNRKVVLETDVEAAAPLPHFSDLWFWTLWPAIAIGLFVAHRGLVHRSELRHSVKTAASGLVYHVAKP